MTGLEIRKRIDECNEKIEEVFNPTQFVLNSETVELMEEIAKLQLQCEHNFVDGVCEFCDMEEDQ